MLKVCSDCFFWLPHHGSSDTEMNNYYLYHPLQCWKSFCLWFKWIPGKVMSWYLPSLTLLHFSLFPLLKSDIEEKDIQKELHIQGKLESHYTCLGKGTGSEEPCRDHKFTLQGKLKTIKIRQKLKQADPLERRRIRRNLILRDTTLLDSNPFSTK